MANKKVFCAVPWHNTHLYWNGTYGVCCSEAQKAEGTKYNLQDTSLIKWYNSDTMQNFRNRILGDEPLPECNGCYQEELHGHQSRRIKENYKVAIFTEHAFEKSFDQSPWNKHFKIYSDKLPIDWHIDFGNECNLACKMCGPNASSKIASYYTKWGIKFENNPNWTNDEESYQQLLRNVQSVPKLHRIHVMGGEPTINKRFIEFVDWLIEKNLTHLSISFVTNGTVLNQKLLENLQKFNRVDIEVSVESTENNNHYIRQGSNSDEVWNNIEYLHTQQNEKLSLVLRTVPQLLSINTYHKLIKKAFDLNISIQSIPLRQPSYLAIAVLPYELRQQFKQNFIDVKESILKNNQIDFKTIGVGRDTSRLSFQLIRECDTMIALLQQPEPKNVEESRKELVDWLTRWDTVFGLDAYEFYPDYIDFFKKYGYSI
jgi:sulfatase maturation enzyme AslB (radical SAM superfamily)